ncbi:MAG: ABC transporter permease [Tissierellia bacterium]|nr:ABC transporter permease [Tissierellia bacterium]
MIKKYIPQPNKREYFTFIFLIVEIILFSLLTDNFLSKSNFISVLQNSAEIALISIGMTMVMIQGGVDLSVGSMMGILAIIAGRMIESGVNNLAILMVVLVLGSLMGSVNGLIVTKLQVPEIITTIGTMNIGRTAIFMMLGGRWITGLKTSISVLSTGQVLGIPILLIIILAFYGIFYYITIYTKFGRHMYAVGSNNDSALMIGINSDKIKLVSYMITGAMVGLSSLLYISRMGSVEMSIGIDTALQCIAAVTLGGTSIKGKGSKGTLLGTLAGVFFISFLRNGIVILGIPSLLENTFIGSLIILSLLFDYFVDRSREKRKAAKIAQ